eukprot:CAMPEP_0194479190 /NCGR_PEP_ID=MMETSP0253-20130528/2395_1 /TAXON_ID=2966 /ORGANISM="Noctiluca scintillans" /LENGTH=39 /DNA_ID= /DNA_START= /DNA_END= /DNA_ORIENTATION=
MFWEAEETKRSAPYYLLPPSASSARALRKSNRSVDLVEA